MKEISVGIIEDSPSSIKNCKDLLMRMGKELGDVNFACETYTNPVDYKIRARKFDILIIEYHLSSYTYGANGFYIAKYTKEKYPECFTIINSSYAPFEIDHMLNEFTNYVDGYAHKKETAPDGEYSLKNAINKYLKRDSKASFTNHKV